MPKSAARVYEVVGNSEKMSGTVVTADGKTISIGFAATLDGMDSPSQDPGVDMVVLTRRRADGQLRHQSGGGEVVYSGSRVLSKDGKVMTLTAKGLNPAGKPVESTVVISEGI